MGLCLYDQLTAGRTDKAAVAREWITYFKEHFLFRDEAGNIVSMATYYDPDIKYVNGDRNTFLTGGCTAAVMAAWYLLPLDPELARELYEATITELGLREDRYSLWRALPKITLYTISYQLALCLAIEFGDQPVVNRLRKICEVFSEPRHFGDGLFGFFYHLGEAHPRGFQSANMMVAEVITKRAGYMTQTHVPDQR